MMNKTKINLLDIEPEFKIDDLNSINLTEINLSNLESDSKINGFDNSDSKDVTKIKLPSMESEFKIYKVEDSQSIIIIGANGSGKSRFGAWIEMNNERHVHRVSAQRSLVVPEYVPLKSLEQSSMELLWGTADKNPNKGARWNWGKYTTSLLNDYDKVLSTLFAKQNQLNNQFVKDCKEKDKNMIEYDKAPVSEIDIIISIWKDIFPHRDLNLEDAKVSAKILNTEYHGQEMSDGERVVLYLMGQCLCAPKNSTIIIDEPEVHLHRSVMNRLWTKLEENRPDCLFIYITHDIQFATGQKNSKKLWIHKYDGGEKWNWEFIEDSEGLPEELLLEIMGTRKKILFVEGNRESLDCALYEHFYSDFYVIPCGSCSKVIESTKALRNNNQLHHTEVFGLIDRDYRSDYEIQGLRRNGIFTLNIAEVENLFCIEEIFETVALHFALDETAIEKAKNYVISSFQRDIEVQIKNAIVNEIKFKLSTVDVNKKTIQEISETINHIPNIIDINKIYKETHTKYEKLKNEGNYREILLHFNQKGISKTIGQFFNYQNKDYCNFIIRLLKTEKKQNIYKGLSQYLPSIE